MEEINVDIIPPPDEGEPAPPPEPPVQQTVVVTPPADAGSGEWESLKAELQAVNERLAGLEHRQDELGVGDRLLMLEAEMDAILEAVAEEEEEPPPAEPVADVPPIPEAPPDAIKPGSTRRQSLDFYRNRRVGGPA